MIKIVKLNEHTKRSLAPAADNARAAVRKHSALWRQRERLNRIAERKWWSDVQKRQVVGKRGRRVVCVYQNVRCLLERIQYLSLDINFILQESFKSRSM